MAGDNAACAVLWQGGLQVGRFEETVVVKYVPFLATMQSVLASLGTPATGAVHR